jgi:hypothetical protein
MMWNHSKHLEAFFGVPCGGGILHTLNLRLHLHEIAVIAKHAGDRSLLIDDVLLQVRVMDLSGFRETISTRGKILPARSRMVDSVNGKSIIVPSIKLLGVGRSFAHPTIKQDQPYAADMLDRIDKPRPFFDKLPISCVTGQVPRALPAEAQSSRIVDLWKTGDELPQKSSKIVPLGTPFYLGLRSLTNKNALFGTGATRPTGELLCTL